MKKVKYLFLLLLLTGFFFLIPSYAEATPVDIVILLDTSESVFPIYNNILNYITKNIITDYLKYGDTLHLITFDSEPSFVFSKQINNKNDIEYILKEFYLILPFGKHTDLVAGLKYLRNYISTISNNSSHEIVILTDGIHGPPAGSQYQSIIDPATGDNILQKEIEELSKSDWKINIIKLPGDSKLDSSKTGGSNSSGISSSANENTSASSVTSSNKEDTSSTLTSGTNSTDNSARNSFDSLSDKSGEKTPDKNSQFGNSSADNSFITKSETTKETSENNIFSYIDNTKISSADFNKLTDEKEGSINDSAESSANNLSNDINISKPDKNSFKDSEKSKSHILLISIIIIILVIIILFFLITKYYSGASVRESYKVVRNDIDIKGIDQEGDKSEKISRRPIIMKVANQNDQVVGTSRNIHPFKTGTVKSIGGGNSTYLIFLYKIHGTIASLKFDGENYIFTPLRPEFFPEIGDKEINNPLEKNIKIKTEKNHILSIRFWEYISPLEKINSIMKLTEHRGIPAGH